MKSIYWFRNDLRVIDNLPLNKAIESSDEILFVYVQDVKSFKDTAWSFSRMGSHRMLYLSQGLNALQEKLSNYDEKSESQRKNCSCRTVASLLPLFAPPWLLLIEKAQLFTAQLLEALRR